MFYNPFSPKGFAKGLANAQLKSFRAFQRKFPALSKEQLYVESLSTRPGYTREEVLDIVQFAKTYITGSFNLQRVVLAVADREYTRRVGHTPSQDISIQLVEGVVSVIPNDL